MTQFDGRHCAHIVNLFSHNAKGNRIFEILKAYMAVMNNHRKYLIATRHLFVVVNKLTIGI